MPPIFPLSFQLVKEPISSYTFECTIYTENVSSRYYSTLCIIQRIIFLNFSLISSRSNSVAETRLFPELLLKHIDSQKDIEEILMDVSNGMNIQYKEKTYIY